MDWYRGLQTIRGVLYDYHHALQCAGNPPFSHHPSPPGKGKYIGVVTDLGLPAQTAWFKIDSTGPLSGFELFGTTDGNQLAAYAGGGGTGAKSGVFAKIEKSGWTGIAFVNTEDSAASVTLTAYTDDGTAVAASVLPVGGHAKVVNYAEGIFSQDISSATYIAYSSDRDVVGFQLNGTLDGMMLDGLPALAGTDTSSFPSSTPTPPSTPTGFALTPVSSSQIDLSWNASPGAPGYNIYKVGTIPQSVTTTSFSDTGLPPLTNHCYYVTAYNSVGESVQTSQLCATTLATPVSVPFPPLALTVTAVSSSQINLSWESSPGNSPGTVTGYKVYKDGAYLKSVTGTSTSDSGLSPSTNYCYYVTAYNSVGESVQTSQLCATTLAAPVSVPFPPIALTVTAVSSSQINLSWESSPGNSLGTVTGYKVYKDGAYLKSVTGTSTSDSGLSPSTNYCYYVTAYNSVGESVQTNQLCATTQAMAYRSYSTNFPLAENPISESGNWINGGTVGLDWNNVRTQISPFKLAYGLQGGHPNYTDATAILTGTWGADQTVEATVYKGEIYAEEFPEVELRLRSAISAHSCRGYEILFSCLSGSSAYLSIVRWNGAVGHFADLATLTGSQAEIKTGDVVKATIVGNTISAYINGVLKLQATDNTFTTGNPGMGFNQLCSSGSCQGASNGYGFTSYMATDGS